MTDPMTTPGEPGSPKPGVKWDYPCLRFSPLLADHDRCGHCQWPARKHIDLVMRPILGIPTPPERC